jgi:hypothetical protein
MGKKPKDQVRDEHNAGEKYFKPRDRFYEFLERHDILSKERKKAERKGALGMTILLCIVIALAFATHKDSEYALVTKFLG